MKNFFDLYQIPIAVNPNKNQVLQQYYALSKLHHPDHLPLGTTDDMKTILAKSAEINQARDIFSSRDKTIDYILSLKASQLQYSQSVLPPDFLMEIMSINELVEECHADPTNSDKKKELKDQIDNMLQSLEKEFEPYLKGYNEFVQDDSTYLAKLNEYRNKRKYISNLIVSLDTTISHHS